MLILTDQNSNDSDMEVMQIKFGGQTNQIEANTLINSLIHFTEVVREVHNGITKELEVDKTVEISINATMPGSFIMDLAIATKDNIQDVSTLFTKDNIKLASDIVKSVGQVYGIAKFLRGKKPKSVEKREDSTCRIENNNGDIYNFDLRGANIYLDNPQIRNAISQQFDTLGDDTNVTGFDLLDAKGEPLFESDKNDMYDIGSPDAEEVSRTGRTKSLKTTLRIVALSWELRKKWDFIYDGRRISAKIKDDTFAELIKKGEPFAMGDALEVEMNVVQEKDDSFNAFVDKSYTIVRIIQHLRRSEQRDLGF